MFRKSPSNNDKGDDLTPIIANESLEHDIVSSDQHVADDAKKSRLLPKQIQRLRLTSTDSNTSENSSRGGRTASVRLISSTSSNLSDLPEDLVIGNDDVVDESENVNSETDNFEGVDCGCCRYGGHFCRFTTGCLLAFASGLTITLNNFVVKATRVNFGEILAIRCIVQIPVMLAYVLIKGHRIWPSTLYERMMLLLVGVLGGLTMLTTFACVKFMPVGDAMTLIFTNPLFTMLFAAIFMGHRLSTLKILSTVVLMAGIVLVTKPPFLFPNNNGGGQNQSLTATASANLSSMYGKQNYFTFNQNPPVPTAYDPADYYFVGALIALSCAIFSAANNIVISLLGNAVSTSVQLLWMGMLAIVVAGLSEFVDDKDRFFTPDIGEISAFEWGICIGIAFLGILGFITLFKALIMIPPSTASTLRTSQIIVAFVAQVLINNNIPEIIDVLGAAFIFVAAMMVTFEEQICKGFSTCCPLMTCCLPHVQVEMREIATQTAEHVHRTTATGRIRTVSHSLS